MRGLEPAVLNNADGNNKMVSSIEGTRSLNYELKIEMLMVSWMTRSRLYTILWYKLHEV